MAGTIQIKRSASTATPSALDFGELACLLIAKQ